MSDGFDKEAEREKLREKFADDDEKREHTQRMSELLLKGATMTNRHCDDCGDPIFRQDGREFCPTCHTVDAADVENADDPAAASDQSDAAGGSAATPAGDEAPPTGGSGPTERRRTDRGPARTNPEPPAGTSDGSESAASASEGGATPTRATGGSGGIDDARASLARTLHKFAAAAEETDDPRRARDHLRAAREAAEALAALDR